jgi:hypothetical protein
LSAIGKADELVAADIVVEVPKGSTALKELESRVAAALAKEDEAKFTLTKTSPLIDELIEKMRRDVFGRAGRNVPNYWPLFRQTKRNVGDNIPVTFGSIGWPIDHKAVAKGDYGKLDTTGLFWWLNADAIAAKAESEIRAMYKPEHAMSSEDRNAAIAKLNAEALALWYEAGAFAELATAEGVNVPYHYRMPPLAILGLKAV